MITDEPCPVADQLLGRLYDSSERNVDDLVSGLPPNRLGELAVFCYRRGHLRDIGVAIAATCDLSALVDAGGKAGNFLFDLSREVPKIAAARRTSRQARITLPTIPANWRPAVKPTEEPESDRELVIALNRTDEVESPESITICLDMP
jgi:hypothetical protein